MNMSDTISISASAAAMRSSLEGCGRPIPKKDILRLDLEGGRSNEGFTVCSWNGDGLWLEDSDSEIIECYMC